MKVIRKMKTYFRNIFGVIKTVRMHMARKERH